MRQGPDYNQWVDRTKDNSPYLCLPLELVEDWSDMKTVLWLDNGDGTYTLKPSKEI
jgi:hypothetical protein